MDSRVSRDPHLAQSLWRRFDAVSSAGGITHNGPISLAMRGEKYELRTS